MNEELKKFYKIGPWSLFLYNNWDDNPVTTTVATTGTRLTWNKARHDNFRKRNVTVKRYLNFPGTMSIREDKLSRIKQFYYSRFSEQTFNIAITYKYNIIKSHFWSFQAWWLGLGVKVERKLDFKSSVKDLLMNIKEWRVFCKIEYSGFDLTVIWYKWFKVKPSLNTILNLTSMT